MISYRKIEIAAKIATITRTVIVDAQNDCLTNS